MITKNVEALVKLRDAFRMAGEAIDEYVDSLGPKEDVGLTWNPDKINWVTAEGAKGKYQRSEDVNNPDFKALLKDLASHSGRMRNQGYFYWSFQNGTTVGRKQVQK